MFGEGEGGVELNLKDPVGVRGVDGGDGGLLHLNGNEMVL
jgi:hypothetical protein